MAEHLSHKVDYMVMVLAEYALARGIALDEGFFELRECGGIDALDEFYDVEHILPVSMTVDDLVAMHARGAA